MFKKILLLFLVITGSSELLKCKLRGGCVCDCSWTKKVPCIMAKDDKSCCFSCCCLENKGNSPTNIPTPSPLPVPIIPVPIIPVQPVPSISIPNQKLYCPSVKDIVVGYGNAKLYDQGWLNKGGGSAATKASFNLLGGYVEFDIDFTNTQEGINGNIYTISPFNIPSSGFTQKNYCDGAKKGSNWCVEIDWIESNGNCGGATTLHTIEGPGSGCTAWGCSSKYKYNGKPSFHMKISYSLDGNVNVYRDNQLVQPYNPQPKPNELVVLVEQYKKYGAVIYSSLWKGWVPMENSCASNGDLPSSSFEVKNLKINGILVQGPEPSLC